ncbi:elongation factor Ts, mitochondrial [Sitodiplosis mosellana]|uniref:elongation factor Ts, mitochondrial n=1 Tax=Sitodiplosis mosellana TaxID=263140 RepID=UPI00244377A0|nr:elongation factor Ts, mitochondrial [Sitodiplosis mosellana]
MFCRQIVRQSLNNIRCYSAEKSPLALLRKKTGYSFVNCKKALELHNNDVTKAEQWLKEQAQAMGWAKATKLEGRETAQGLVGVVLQKNIGALIEVNCETDFVARNEKFQQFVDLASKACLKYVSGLPESDLISRTEFQAESLKNLVSSNNKKLADEMALMIGSVGENAALRRAVCFKVPQSVQLIGMAYPSPNVVADNETQGGSIGTIVGIRSQTEVTDELKKNLCLQVIGSNPLKVGNKEQDKPAKDSDDETCLIFQEYVFDPTIKVGQLLEERQIEIVDYQRYKCGENVDSEENVSAATAN